MYTEEREEGCVDMIQCHGADYALDVWRTSDASWMDPEGADEEETMSINMVEAAEERLSRCQQIRKSS
jgi:hypothetical protein